jgi:hypothetical protein
MIGAQFNKCSRVGATCLHGGACMEWPDLSSCREYRRLGLYSAEPSDLIYLLEVEMLSLH